MGERERSGTQTFVPPYVRHTCIRSRVSDVITLISVEDVLSPGVQSEFITGAENWTWC